MARESSALPWPNSKAIGGGGGGGGGDSDSDVTGDGELMLGISDAEAVGSAPPVHAMKRFERQYLPEGNDWDPQLLGCIRHASSAVVLHRHVATYRTRIWR